MISLIHVRHAEITIRAMNHVHMTLSIMVEHRSFDIHIGFFELLFVSFVFVLVWYSTYPKTNYSKKSKSILDMNNLKYASNE